MQQQVRQDWADAARGLGMVLVYYGHVAAAVTDLHGAGLWQMRFIYAFHMPLFFVLSGMFFRVDGDRSARRQELTVRRLAPVIFFSALLLPLWMAGPLLHHESVWNVLAPSLLAYLHGHPDLNWVTWFLVCLWVCECMALSLLPRLPGAAAQALVGAALILLGVVACNHADATAALIGIEVSAWFLYEACVALGFLLIGHAARPAMDAVAQRPAMALGLALGGFAGVVWMLDWNAELAARPVMMAAARHGDPLAFALTALSGTAGALGLAVLLQSSTTLVMLGRHTIALLGLGGVFFHFVNRVVLRWQAPPDSLMGFSTYDMALTIVSLLLCWPVAGWLQRRWPFWMGRWSTNPHRTMR